VFILRVCDRATATGGDERHKRHKRVTPRHDAQIILDNLPAASGVTVSVKAAQGVVCIFSTPLLFLVPGSYINQVSRSTR
jgi:hypothetical protein